MQVGVYLDGRSTCAAQIFGDQGNDALVFKKLSPCLTDLSQINSSLEATQLDRVARNSKTLTQFQAQPCGGILGLCHVHVLGCIRLLQRRTYLMNTLPPLVNS